MTIKKCQMNVSDQLQALDNSTTLPSQTTADNGSHVTGIEFSH
jgi:hypothetical protein